MSGKGLAAREALGGPEGSPRGPRSTETQSANAGNLETRILNTGPAWGASPICARNADFETQGFKTIA
eukprot:5878503-Alexandrium_andersonii.AAC.1